MNLCPLEELSRHSTIGMCGYVVKYQDHAGLTLNFLVTNGTRVRRDVGNDAARKGRKRQRQRRYTQT